MSSRQFPLDSLVILDEALACAAIHVEQHKALLSKIDVIVVHSIAFQKQNSALTKELCVANEHVEFLHNQPQLQVQVPGVSTFTTTTLLPTEIAPVENSSAEASAHGPVTIPTPSPTTFLAAAKKAMGKRPNQPKLTTAQATHALQPKSGPSAYAFVYLPCNHHLKYSQVQKLLRTFKIQQSRVLDISFPERGTLSLLVHNDFKDKITQLFADIGVSVKTDFDPLNHWIIADPAHAHKPLHCHRLLALCLRLPAPLGKSVMRHFCTVESSSLRLPSVCLEQYLEDRNLPSGPQASAIDTATAMLSWVATMLKCARPRQTHNKNIFTCPPLMTEAEINRYNCNDYEQLSLKQVTSLGN
ncbi:hypothetical protein PHYBLDRAFT_153145 [Phycomyces blakesleeanus NRRL 1555(-)]|uniref:Uncharacterized protein n=1 Tax=Phycomyces blakesleeanus (strain ATCC 8743b / DSM 1359 / FGSC 10004 / NBRC 33097 / NRRL 1555) TaxID=763407 RepID=A0A167JBQ5_PHYB8|nr:hypothetical protein PHYBLDRAFT_153145 [Phycomyces blakesleeanus NRRL 1555(-)]OAD65666.1 hypothetical protein PHYBLDRAFT_153145 [Phycomyces blakesleeanus NRRL 1555(-)]|eukprot:XP_018283706.1 hypothetical protein PHYBLDRAFT_153145 [Phycomyces blakesleeanus NRRL 1555(-)]